MKYSILAILLLTVSCGKDSSDSSKGQSFATEVQEEQQMSDGDYRAVLRPLNPTSNGFIPYGNAEIRLKGDSFSVKTYLDDDSPVNHRQSIHRGTKCPTIQDDQNGDGLIDIEEAYAVVGEVLIPLDSDINTESAGANSFPRGTSFTYDRTASLSRIQKDLGETFSVIGKVILIHGTAATEKVPATVATRDGLPNHLSIPVVCGTVERLDGSINP